MRQRGLGFNKFEGSRYQRGHGWGSFFGRMYKILKPALKYVGKQAIDTGINVGRDILSGENVKQSIKRRAKEKGDQIIDTIEQKVAQTGSGIKRCKMARRRRRTKTIKSKRARVLKGTRSYTRKRRTRKRGSKAKQEFLKKLCSNLRK